MKQSDLNHLRRINAWVRLELGSSPDDLKEIYKDIMPAVLSVGIEDQSHLPSTGIERPEEILSEFTKEQMVKSMDRAQKVPERLRVAVREIESFIRDVDRLEYLQMLNLKNTKPAN